MSLYLTAGAWKRAAGGGIVSLGLLQMARFRPVYRSEHIVAIVTLKGLIPLYASYTKTCGSVSVMDLN